MKRDVGGAGCGEVGHDAIDGTNHQMHVDRRRNAVFAQGLAHQRADRQIRDVMVVHHVEVDQVRAGGQYRVNFRAEARKVGR